MQIPGGYIHISPDKVAEKVERGEHVILVDVRADWEYMDHRIPGVRHMPLDGFAERAPELPRDQAIILICEHGIRSEAAAQYLATLGYGCVATMDGGMASYEGTVIRG